MGCRRLDENDEPDTIRVAGGEEPRNRGTDRPTDEINAIEIGRSSRDSLDKVGVAVGTSRRVSSVSREVEHADCSVSQLGADAIPHELEGTKSVHHDGGRLGTGRHGDTAGLKSMKPPSSRH